MTAPTLSGFAPFVTFAENTVNTASQLLDSDVTFADAEGDFDGGTLSLTGLLAEDTASVRDEGTGAGQIGLSGANVTFGGVTIGTLAGGVGASLAITFNAAATSVSIDALIQNLTYANSSDTPTASRDLTLNVLDAAGENLIVLVPPEFTALTGTANPFDGIDVILNSVPSFVDLDGDGDLDLVVGEFYGTLKVFDNNDADAGFTELTGAANPFDGVDAGSFSAPSFVDLDGDGDLDLVVGGGDGTLRVYDNNDADAGFTELTGAANPFDGIDVGSISNPSFVDLDGDSDLDLVVGANDGTLRLYDNNNTDAGFTELTGAANPFTGIDVGLSSAPSFVDLDGDGDLDLVVGESNVTLVSYENTTPRGEVITVTVTAENDTPTATGLPVSIAADEAIASNVDLSGISVNDAENDTILLTITASSGVLNAVSSAGVLVLQSSEDTVQLFGTATALNTYLQDISAIRFTGEQDVFGDGAATLSVSTTDLLGENVLQGTVQVDIAALNSPPELSGLETSITFNENAVNTAPQLLDSDVSFTDIYGNFDGGMLSLSGLLAEDTVSVRNEGTGVGEIGLSGTDVSFGGVVIGVLMGGAGEALTITFNASATSPSIDALIQNLTYANNSDTPTASRDLVLNVIDARGANLNAPLNPSFAPLAGAANPFNGIDVGFYSNPNFIDLDGDGDLDLVVGEYSGILRVFDHNDANAGFTELLGSANTFNGIDIGNNSAPSFVDLDGDGDLDLVVADNLGALRVYHRNNFDAGFTEQTGVNNPFNGLAFGFSVTPSFVDLDGDGDQDLVVGQNTGTLRVFDRNDADTGFTELTGVANPFNGIDIGSYSTPSFVDLDGDGDQDLVVGELGGTLRVFDNNDADAGFTELTEANNPFDGIDVSLRSTPSFVDLDGDGDLDLVAGEAYGTLVSFENTTPRGEVISVNVTAQDEAPTISGLVSDVTVVEEITTDVDLSAVVLSVSNANAGFTLTLSASSGILNAVSTAMVTISGAGTGTLVLTGFGVDIDAFLNDSTAIQYTGVQNLSGGDAAVITLTADDGDGDVALGSVNVDITNTNDAPTFSGFMPLLVTYDEAVTSNVDLSGMTLNDIDGDQIQLMIAATTGLLTAASSAGVLVQFSGSATLLLTGTALALNTYLSNTNAIQFTGEQDVFGSGAALLTISSTDLIGAPVIHGTVQVNITDIVETQTGDAGANTLLGGLGVDVLSGGDGNDILRGLGGADTLDGGDGKDWLQYKGSDFGVTVDLNVDLLGFQSASGGHATGDVISGFENVRGSAFADTLTGNDGKNALRGGGGADTLDGGLGTDWLIYKGSDAGVTVDLNADGSGFQSATGGHASGDVISGFERVRGSALDDVLTGDDQNNRLKGAGGDDTLDGGTGNDRLFGGAGSDVFIFSSGDGDDEINGGDGVDLAQFNGFDSTDFTVVDLGGSAWTVTENATGDVDTITGIEILQFDDTALFSF